MKPLALLLALTVGLAGPATAGELSDAARAAKEKRAKSTTKVITNADVKKSKGTVISSGATATPVEKQPTLTEKHEAARAAEKASIAARSAAGKKVQDLEMELHALEQAYYDENDLNRRDTVIVARFNEVKSRLDAARAELAALMPKPPETAASEGSGGNRPE